MTRYVGVDLHRRRSQLAPSRPESDQGKHPRHRTRSSGMPLCTRRGEVSAVTFGRDVGRVVPGE